MTPAGKPVVASTAAEAISLIAKRMITDYMGWPGFVGTVMTDAEYERLLTEADEKATWENL
jgi:hypothetical protein